VRRFQQDAKKLFQLMSNKSQAILKIAHSHMLGAMYQIVGFHFMLLLNDGD
jgi:hypothetical protein